MRPTIGKTWFSIGLILAVALAWDGMVLHAVRGLPLSHWHQWDQTDMHVFAEQAKRIAAGDWLGRDVYYPYHLWMVAAPAEVWRGWYSPHVFYQAPLYCYMLAGFIRAGLDPADAARAVQMFAVAAIAVLSFLVTRRMFGRAAGLAAGIMASIYGPLLMIASQPLKEPLALALTMWILFGLTGWMRRPKRVTAFWIGLGLGVLAMLHEGTPPVVLCVFICMLVRARNRLASRSLGEGWNRNRSTAREVVPRSRSGYCMGSILLLALGFLLGFAPLLARNVAVGASPFAVSTRSPITWALANEASAPAGGVTWSSPVQSFVDLMNHATGRPLGIVRGVFDSYHGQWWLFFEHWGRRALALMTAGEAADNTCYAYFKLYVPILNLSLDFRWLLPLAAMGIVRGRTKRWLGALRRGSASSVSIVYLVLLIAALSAVFPLGRLRLFLLPALIPLAGRGVIGLIAALQSRRAARTAAMLAVAVAIFIMQLAIEHTWKLGGLRPADFDTSIRIHLALGDRDLAEQELARKAELLGKK
ncbi:hypothetical protein LLG95_15330 [bacterium]|nr:hypothetical protein [bacterium]